MCGQGHEVMPGAVFCQECGQDVRPRCSQGHPGQLDDTFCETCGGQLQPVALAAQPVTALLVDMENPLEQTIQRGSVALPPTVAPTYRSGIPEAAPAWSESRPPVYDPPAAPHVWERPAGNAAPTVDSLAALPPFHLDLRRLSRIDQLTGGAAAVCLLSLFLPWFKFGDYAHVSGLRSHVFLVFAFLVAFLLLAYLALRAGWDRMPLRLPVAHAPLLLLGAGLLLLLVLVAFLWEPQGLSRTFGAWLALASALLAVLPVGVAAMQSVQGAR